MAKKEYHAYHFGTKLLEELLGSKKFDFPKSIYLIIDILKLVSKEDAIILDFFAGSGTTGHAVLELNKEDGGNRKFILCTNNEISEDDKKRFKEKYNISESQLVEWKNNKKKNGWNGAKNTEYVHQLLILVWKKLSGL